jgi:hypothetical protein
VRRRFSTRREVAIGLGAYALYLLVRAGVVRERGLRRARHNSERIAALERTLGLDVGPALQVRVLRRRKLVAFLNVLYLLLNSGLSAAWLAVLYRRRDPHYHRLRSAFLLAHVVAQPIFLGFPTAPPRALDGYVDTLREVNKLDIDRSPLVVFYNPVAAMPSIHVAYAVIAAGGLAGKRRFALGYPPAVTFVVLATGNHFVLDVLAGAALGAVSLRWAPQ